MLYINYFIIFVFGTIIGSFLNVVILRYNTGMSITKGRSMCFSCGKSLTWYELVPLFSYLFLRGKCSVCKSKISSQYPLVEFTTGLLFVLSFMRFGLSPMLPIYMLTVSVLIAMAVYDLKHKIIPDGMVYLFVILSLVTLFFSTGHFSLPDILDFMSGPILFSFFAFFFLVSSGRWMGFGDAKLALGVGWFLGFEGGIYAITMAFWIGAIFSIILLLLQKFSFLKSRLTMKSELPFAPFIILGFFLNFFTGYTMYNIINLL